LAYCSYATGEPEKDIPFVQAFSTIYAYEDLPVRSPMWNKLPFSEPIVQLLTINGPAVEHSQILVLTDKEIYLWNLSGDRDFVPLTAALQVSLGMSNRLSQQLFFLSDNDDQPSWILVTDTSLFLCSLNFSDPCTILLDHLALPPLSSVAVCNSNSNSNSPGEGQNKSALGWIGTAAGVMEWNSDHNTLTALPNIDALPISAVGCFGKEESTFVASTPIKVYYRRGNVDEKSWRWRFEYLNGVIDAAVTAFAHDAPTGDLYMGNVFSLSQQYANGSILRIDGLKASPGSPTGGLPHSNITAMTVTQDYLWIGTTSGLIRKRLREQDPVGSDQNDWSFYNGTRFLPGDSLIVSLSSLFLDVEGKATEICVVASDGGLTLLELRLWTLREKAEWYAATMVRHNRYGLVEDTPLKAFGDLSAFTMSPTANSGLWTSQYVASQCFRYAVTKDPAVKQAAWAHFEGMEFLFNVTCIKGYPARSFGKVGDPGVGGGSWHNSSCHPGWMWWGDTSSDEIVGHMFAYPLVYDLLAETAEEKERVRQVISTLMNTIVDNGYALIGASGKPTLWGRWAPEYLNDDMKYYDGRGVNSLQILSWLSAAHVITGEDKFLQAWQNLTDAHTNQYLQNVVNFKITIPSDDNFSDDELSWLPIMTWARAIKQDSRWSSEELAIGVYREFQVVAMEKPSQWNYIYAATLDDPQQLPASAQADALWDLRGWSPSLVDWPIDNHGREDITFNPNTGRFGRVNSNSIQLLPRDERVNQRWNDDPFNLAGGSGMSELDPSPWLLPYWMAVYYGLVSE
jgi:hypothetical protein